MAFFDISQGSVVTQLRCGGIISQSFVANLLVNLSVKEVWKSVNIWRSYGQYCSALFFLTHSVYIIYAVHSIFRFSLLNIMWQICVTAILIHNVGEPGSPGPPRMLLLHLLQKRTFWLVEQVFTGPVSFLPFSQHCQSTEQNTVLTPNSGLVLFSLHPPPYFWCKIQYNNNIIILCIILNIIYIVVWRRCR